MTPLVSLCLAHHCARSLDAIQAEVSCREESAITEAEAARGSRELVQALMVEAAGARRWRYAWTAINGLSAVAPLAALPFVRREIRPDLLAGSVTSAVSAGVTLFWPLEVENAPEQLRSIPDLGPCERWHVAQAVADSASADEISRRAWPWHVVNFGISAALGAVLAFGFDHPVGGIVTGLSGFAVGEAQLFTQPANLRDMQLPSSLTVHPVWLVTPNRSIAMAGAVFEWSFPSTLVQR